MSLDDTYKSVISRHFEGGFARARAEDAIDRYYHREVFSGARFELVADTSKPNEITARDIVAVSTLGVDIPAAVSIWLLGDGKEAVSELLAAVPTDIDVWDALPIFGQRDALWRLWDLLNEGCWPSPVRGNGMGPTRLSKLMSAKRPRLVPIQDDVVEKLFPYSENYWSSFGYALSDPRLRHQIEIATSSAPNHISLLRRVDVVLWMLNRKSR